MTKAGASKSGPWGLRTDLLTVHGLLWIARVRPGGEPRPEVHLYLYDRYWRLAEYHERRGRSKKASRLRMKAMIHYRQSGSEVLPLLRRSLCLFHGHRCSRERWQDKRVVIQMTRRRRASLRPTVCGDGWRRN